MLLIAFSFSVFIQGCYCKINTNEMSKVGDVLERNNHKFIVVPNNWLKEVDFKALMKGMKPYYKFHYIQNQSYQLDYDLRWKVLKEVDDIKNLDFTFAPEEKFTEDIGNYASFSQPKRTAISVQQHRIESFKSKLLKMNLTLGVYMFSHNTNKEEVSKWKAIDSLLLTFLISNFCRIMK